MFKVLRNGLLRYILYTCPNLNVTRVQSATQWTASIHTLHVEPFFFGKLKMCKALRGLNVCHPFLFFLELKKMWASCLVAPARASRTFWSNVVVSWHDYCCRECCGTLLYFDFRRWGGFLLGLMVCQSRSCSQTMQPWLETFSGLRLEIWIDE